jgi:hypothetical protein
MTIYEKLLEQIKGAGGFIILKPITPSESDIETSLPNTYENLNGVSIVVQEETIFDLVEIDGVDVTNESGINNYELMAGAFLTVKRNSHFTKIIISQGSAILYKDLI